MPKEASKKSSEDDLGVPSTVVDVITEKVAATVSGLVGRQVAAALQEAGLLSWTVGKESMLALLDALAVDGELLGSSAAVFIEYELRVTSVHTL